MAAFLMAVSFRGMTVQETTALTLAMVRSGETLDLSGIRGPTVDKHSTGGVGDKTSLVLVPLVASAGVRVAKLSGRGLGHTGGTLDKLEAIPHFRVELSPAELIAQVNRIGCAITSQSARLVPADKRLYALRDQTATVDSVPLIASSVMSKKIAAGSAAIVLDVKAGSGAFMKTLADARALAQAMVGIGREVGRRTVAVLTAMDEPLGRAVGNALEVDEAVQTLRGEGPEDLRALCLTLGERMTVLAGLVPDAAAGRTLLLERLRRGDAWRKFLEMVTAQGGEAEAVEHPERLPRSPLERPVGAEGDGTVLGIDAEAIGEAAMLLGAGRTRAEDRIDPGAGLMVHRKIGDRVRRGDPLATLYTRDGGRLEGAARRVREAYRLGPIPEAPGPLVLEIVE
jgi:pyrimidine-nucleoside phosphorylase